MRKNRIVVLFWFALCLALLPLGWGVQAQIPTDTPLPLAPTETPSGPMVYAPDVANLRLYPNKDSEQVGSFAPGQTAIVLGKTEIGDWLLVEYFGAPNNQAWVFRELVQLRNVTIDAIPVVEVPEFVTGTETPTLEPGVGAGGTPLPERLPTYTPAPPVEVPQFEQTTGTQTSGIPPALYIIGLFMLSLLAGLLSLIRRRIG